MDRRALLLAIAGCALAGHGAAAPVPPALVQIGQVPQDVLMRGLNGPDRRLSAYRGRPLIINVWASWCGPCRAEMASLERLAWLDEAAGFAVIGISTDDDAAAARQFLSRSRTTLNHYLDHDLELESLLGANRLPLTLLVDAEGRLRRRVYGAQRWDGPEALQLVRSAFGTPTRGPASGRPPAAGAVSSPR
ncbi:MAG: hypothetical protein RLZZ200_932 [Pseudomonadota bacterium]|jgi:thiol-disulfide isomerase/thioredoxin